MHFQNLRSQVSRHTGAKGSFFLDGSCSRNITLTWNPRGCDVCLMPSRISTSAVLGFDSKSHMGGVESQRKVGLKKITQKSCTKANTDARSFPCSQGQVYTDLISWDWCGNEGSRTQEVGQLLLTASILVSLAAFSSLSTRSDVTGRLFSSDSGHNWTSCWRPNGQIWQFWFNCVKAASLLYLLSNNAAHLHWQANDNIEEILRQENHQRQKLQSEFSIDTENEILNVIYI